MKRNFLFIFLTVLLSLLITAVAAMVTLYGAQSQSTAETLKSDTAIYADLVKNEGYEVLDSIKSFGTKRVTVINNDGDVLFESDKYSDMENHLYREEVQAALNGKPSVTSRYSEMAKRQMFYYALAVNVGGETFVVRTAAPVSETTQYLLSSGIALGIALVISLVAAYLLCRVVVNRINSKLGEIQASINSISEGNYVPLRADMKDGYLYPMMTGITEVFEKTKRQMDEIKSEKNKSQLLLDNITDGIVAVDGADRIAFINKSGMELFGCDEQVVGKPLIYLFDKNSLECHEKTDGKSEYQYETEDRYYKVTEVNSDSDIKSVYIFTDVTKEKLLIKQKSEFFANASHELKTPLTSIHGMAELLLNKDADEQTHKYAARIFKESDRLNLLIMDMLKLSRLENKNGEFTDEWCDVRCVAEEVADELKEKAEEKQLDVKINGQAMLFIDKKKLYEVISNICSNAVHYNKNGGSIKIDIIDRPSSVTLSVADTGIGIEQKHIPRLCERFYRVDKSHSKSTGGTGLGLAIVKHICSLYDAKLDIQSKPDKGTTVTVSFPKKDA